jgi:DNA-binding response OmpR family regulator
MRILLVEDDENLAKALAAVLSKQNYLVDISQGGEIAWEMIHIIDYDLVLLDVNLPKLDGLGLCKRLRDHNQRVPIMLMTVRDSMTDKLIGLESGADDYLVKPFDIQELLVRIRVLSRRLSEQSTPILTCGNIRLNPEMRQISCNDKVIPFSRKEYLLIELFLRHPHRVFSRAGIVDHLWSLDDLPTEDTVKSHIRRIRRKLSEVGAEDLIETLYGHGYRINPAFLKHSPSSSDLPPDQESELNQVIEQVWQNIRAGVLQQVSSLDQAVALLQAGILDRDSLQQARETAHKLAGTVGSCGFEAASYIARAIESLLNHNPSYLAITDSLSQLVKTLRFELEQSPKSVVEPDTHPDSPDSLPERAAHSQEMRVLAIDDDISILVLLKQILKSRGIQVATLEHPTSIWSILETVRPDLLILDINMPEINGLELCQTIRATAQWSWLPILILTVQTDRQVVQQIFSCNADDYLAKPIVPDELAIRVLNQIRRSKHMNHR